MTQTLSCNSCAEENNTMQRVILFSSAFRAILTGSGGLHARYSHCTRHENVFRTQLRKHSQDQPSNNTAHFSCFSLPHRTLINVSGQDTNSFLQGIITNDMALLEEDAVCAKYAHILNVQGRTLYDTILYR